MEAKHISFPSIGQFREVIKQVHSAVKWFQIQTPTLKFTGTVKLHGTNFGICRPVNGTVDDIYFQSRERIITPLSDNAGAAMWGYSVRNELNKLFDSIAHDLFVGETGVIQIFGEWAGGNIQKGVGLNKIEKSFFVFGIRVSEDSDSTVWKPRAFIEQKIGAANIKNMYHIYQFPTWEVAVDFNNPQEIQNLLGELTLKVEEDCPVSRQLLGPDAEGPLVGEGIVWTLSDGQDIPFNLGRFKVKGEKHSVSKVKTLAAVDVEKVRSVDEFVINTVTLNRLQQGLDKMREKGLSIDARNTGEFIKWVMADVFKEELDTLAESGLTTKDVSGKMANTARNFYLENLE